MGADMTGSEPQGQVLAPRANEMTHDELLTAVKSALNEHNDNVVRQIKDSQAVIDDRLAAGNARMDAMQGQITANGAAAQRSIAAVDELRAKQDRRMEEMASAHTTESEAVKMEVRGLAKTVNQHLGFANAIKWLGILAGGCVTAIVAYFETFGKGGS